MVEWILFLPIVFLGATIVIFRLFSPRLSPQAREGLSLALLAIEILTILANIAPIDHQVVISDYPLAAFTLALRINGPALLLLLSMFVVQIALWLVAPPRAPFDPTAVLVLITAVVLVLAANLATVYVAWILFDVAVLVWRLGHDIERENAVRAFGLSQIAGMLLLAGSMMASSLSRDQGVMLIATAFWARLALFPFQWIYPLRGTTSRDLWTARGIPLVASASLWIQWSTLQLHANPPGQWIAILVTLACLAYAAWMWREEQPSRAAIVTGWHAVALVPLSLAYGGDGGLAYALWLTLCAAFAIGLFEMALRWRAENRNRWSRLIWFAGVLCVSGIPLSPAFLGRIGLYVTLYESGNWWLMLLMGAVTMLALAPLWAFGSNLEGAEDRDPTRSEYAGLGVLGAALVVLGLAPTILAHVLAPELGASADAVMARVVWTDDLLGVGVAAFTVLASLVGSFMLSPIVSNYQPRPRSLIPRLGRFAELHWFERMLTGIVYQMGVTGRNLSMIAEQNPALWTIFVALWIAIFVLFPH